MNENFEKNQELFFSYMQNVDAKLSLKVQVHLVNALFATMKPSDFSELLLNAMEEEGFEAIKR